MTPIDVVKEMYKSAAAEAALLELNMRLLADKTSALQQYAYKNWEEVEEKITEHFHGNLSEEDKKQLCLCRKLRNKILHANFPVARETLNNLGHDSILGTVEAIDMATGTIRNVSNIPNKEPGTIYGWLLELNSSEDITNAVSAFKKAQDIVHRLSLS